MIFQVTEKAFIDPKFFDKRVIFNYKDEASEDFTKKIVRYTSLCNDTISLLDAITDLEPTASTIIVDNQSGDILLTFINKLSVLDKYEADEESATNIGIIAQFLKNA